MRPNGRTREAAKTGKERRGAHKPTSLDPCSSPSVYFSEYKNVYEAKTICLNTRLLLERQDYDYNIKLETTQILNLFYRKSLTTSSQI